MDIKEQVINLRKQKVGYKKIGKILGIGQDTVSKILISNGYTNHVKLPPQETIDAVVKMYVDERLSTRVISKELGIGRKSVTNILMITKNEVRPTAYHTDFDKKINHNFFEKIDSERKAYWLGFLMADGYNNEKLCQIEVSLKSEDTKLLEYLKSDLEAIYEVKEKNVSLNGKTFKASRLILYSKKLSKDLANKGCIQNKSLVLQFPNAETVPLELINHFIRGYFDGDGMISYSGNKNKPTSTKFSFTGNYDFIIRCEKLIRFNVDISDAAYYKEDGKAITWMHAGLYDAIKFSKWLYKDATIYLERKYNKFLDLNTYAENKNCRSKLKTTEDLE